MEAVKLKIHVNLQRTFHNTPPSGVFDLSQPIEPPAINSLKISASDFDMAIRVSCDELFGHEYTERILHRSPVVISEAKVKTFDKAKAKYFFSTIPQSINLELSSEIFLRFKDRFSLEVFETVRTILMSDVWKKWLLIGWLEGRTPANYLKFSQSEIKRDLKGYTQARTKNGNIISCWGAGDFTMVIEE